jgi:hypothetical protein
MAFEFQRLVSYSREFECFHLIELIEQSHRILDSAVSERIFKTAKYLSALQRDRHFHRNKQPPAPEQRAFGVAARRSRGRDLEGAKQRNTPRYGGEGTAGRDWYVSALSRGGDLEGVEQALGEEGGGGELGRAELGGEGQAVFDAADQPRDLDLEGAAAGLAALDEEAETPGRGDCRVRGLDCVKEKDNLLR